jgi:hypothetical protein
VGEAKTGKEWTKISWFIPGLMSAWRKQGRKDGRTESKKLQWEVDLFRERMRRQGDRFLGFLDEISAPLMTLRTIGNPFFRFSFAGGAKEIEVRSSAQFECLLKFLGCTTEVFFMEIDFCKKPVKGRAILHP